MGNLEEEKGDFIPLLEWEEGFMTIPEFRDELLSLYGSTNSGKAVNINFTHYLIQQGKLPFYMGGNELEVRIWRSQKVVRVSNVVRTASKGKGRINYSTIRRMGGMLKYKGKAYKPTIFEKEEV